MVYKLSSNLLIFTAIIAALMIDSSQAAGARPPAGQMCAEGSYVTGFDPDGNIICSAPGGNNPVEPVETMDKVNSQDDEACPAGCLKATGVTDTGGANPVTEIAAKEETTVHDVAMPVISDVKPSWVVFGARETSIAIIGAGFTSGSVVKFQGSEYAPSVNPAGTELRVTVATRELPIGRYAITVSNGPGKEATQRRALEVY